MCNKADSFREFTLIVQVLRALKTNTQQTIQERELENEHEQRKQQIDSFFQSLKSKVANENNLKQAELEKR